MSYRERVDKGLSESGGKIIKQDRGLCSSQCEMKLGGRRMSEVCAHAFYVFV